MRSVTITTRTLPPTDTQGKRVRVKSQDGTVADYPWDHRFDTPEMPEHAARTLAVLGTPNEPVTVQRIESNAMGYTFRALIGS